MNWTNFIIVSLLATGGFIASSYEIIAQKMNIPVGKYFQRNNYGIMVIIGGIIALFSVILSAFVNPWWSFFLVFIAGYLLSQIVIRILKSLSQPISALFMILGILFAFIYIL